MRIERIIFLQDDSQANKDAFRALEKRGTKAAVRYLKQWHYPGEHDTSEKLGHGRADDVYRYGRYILTVNEPLGYMGLEYADTISNQEAGELLDFPIAE